MVISADAAAAAMRDALRETVRRHSLLYLIQGVLMLVTGVLALIYPWIASVTIVRLLGWFLIISGMLQGIGLISAREVPYFWLEVISAVLAIVIGLLLLRHIDAGMLFFGVLFIVYFMIEGILKTMFALTIRPLPNWGLVLASGLIGIALSVYLWTNLSTTGSMWMLGVLLGILLVVEGTALTSLAWRVRREI
ncbi:MAG: HdeD family acid-resistance protein [Methyloceanibacter sp.]